MLAKRQRNSYAAVHYFAAAAALLLLLSVFLLYKRLSSDIHTSVSLIHFNFLNEQEITRGLNSPSTPTGYYFDHTSSVVRRAFHRRSVDDADQWTDFATPFVDWLTDGDDRYKVVFGSDDVPVDVEWQRKLVTVSGIEDALLLKLGFNFSLLRDGWGSWFDAKSVFLRKDRMFKSSLEVLNPMNNPLLQGVTGLTRGDKLVQKELVHVVEKASSIMKKSPEFPGYKPDLDHPANELSSMINMSLNNINIRKRSFVDQEIEIGQRESTTSNDDINDASYDYVLKGVYDKSLGQHAVSCNSTSSKMHQSVTKKTTNSTELNESESSGSMYAGGKRWGYFPELHPYLSFSNFMDSFLRKCNCTMRVFMVWNSPPWMYTVRHQRGLESVLFHHPEACIIVFSETLELDFFKEFIKDGYKIAVTMPNLEELLKDTPTDIFASVWHEWRTTRFYSTHYSELVRLAALYKYGGLYLDCDVIVLKPISVFNNSIGLEVASVGILNGAVMAFSKHSSFIMQCMLEFYSTYDDTLLRWNGADLLTRVAGNFSVKANDFSKEQILKVQPASIFFPISSYDIQRYFIAPLTDSEKAHQEALLKKILNESYTFHFWNSLTSALVPEPYSMVAEILNSFCIRCYDVL